MADRYLLESGAPDGYQLEDGSGVLLLEDGQTPLDFSIDPIQPRKLNTITTALAASIGLIAPVFTPIADVAEAFFASAQSVQVNQQNPIQYQALAQPPTQPAAPEEVTLDKWLGYPAPAHRAVRRVPEDTAFVEA